MASKKYTLYFKGVNKYGHVYNYPIINLPIRDMDVYTSNYKDYKDLFDSLPKKVYKFISENLSYNINTNYNKILKECFFITDNDFNPIIDVIFENNIDILYVTQEELLDLLLKKKMGIVEFQKSLLKTNTNKVSESRYNFFRNLYLTFVKDKKISCMIDVYDIKKALSYLDEDNIMIGSLATDVDNIKVLSKKISQTMESRRELAFMYKNTFDKNNRIASYNSVSNRKNTNVDINEIYKNIISNYEHFIDKYKKDYE